MIDHADIIKLGFIVTDLHDNVFEQQHGFASRIYQKKLTKRVYLDWDQITRECRIVRTDKDHYIIATRCIPEYKVMMDLILFFTGDKQSNQDHTEINFIWTENL